MTGPRPLSRCQDCWDFLCPAHLAEHRCGEHFYEIDGKPVTRSEFLAARFNPPAATSQNYRCPLCPDPLSRALASSCAGP